jgi:5'-3' exonuclease
MASFAVQGERAGHEIALVTSDKDMWPLVTEKVRLLLPGTRDDYSWVGRAEVIAKWGVPPSTSATCSP